MSIVDYLYRGAPAGERGVVQSAVKNMPYSAIGKNIIAEGVLEKAQTLEDLILILKEAQIFLIM